MMSEEGGKYNAGEDSATVDEAATYLGRSTEQVRRYLREESLMGYRVGNQWFIDRKTLERFKAAQGGGYADKIALMTQAHSLRERILRRSGRRFDATRLMKETRRGR
jgi:excisionase family DNA binding protein